MTASATQIAISAESNKQVVLASFPNRQTSILCLRHGTPDAHAIRVKLTSGRKMSGAQVLGLSRCFKLDLGVDFSVFDIDCSDIPNDGILSLGGGYPFHVQLRSARCFEFFDGRMFVVLCWNTQARDSSGVVLESNHIQELEELLFQHTKTTVERICGISSSHNPTFVGWRFGYFHYLDRESGRYPHTLTPAAVAELTGEIDSISHRDVENNLFSWTCSFIVYADDSPNISNMVLVDEAVVVFACYQYESTERLHERLHQSLAELFHVFEARRESLSAQEVIDRYIEIGMEIHKLGNSDAILLSTYDRRYQVMLKQIYRSWKMDRILASVNKSAQDLMVISEKIASRIDAKAGARSQKILYVLAFYSIPSLITDATAFLGVQQELDTSALRLGAFVLMALLLSVAPAVYGFLMDRTSPRG
jgi:hypothetical protein